MYSFCSNYGAYYPSRRNAAWNADFSRVFKALRSAAPRFDINERSSIGSTLTLHAARKDYLSFMEAMLIEWGDDVDLSLKDADGLTAVDYAVKWDLRLTLDMFDKWPQLFSHEKQRLERLREEQRK
ncbi:uncharacterized protein B0I36DRAFT_332504 [Microdochium trichocladiopsis]|uniref:Ankyrin repeat-containing domain protein n=1 Tax=Microdochium trichocladiopsis TaxID=1682393 RepID=A0A9P8XYX4_9PEZI|nr:uncharacterized protein B0I36DRAFT_332504 [Microdochium trichocladiopsis]KAH7025085.1 hypothetical protein B0I36DRAFT_332504 [Microdochium trichocladiopsis]